MPRRRRPLSLSALLALVRNSASNSAAAAAAADRDATPARGGGDDVGGDDGYDGHDGDDSRLRLRRHGRRRRRRTTAGTTTGTTTSPQRDLAADCEPYQRPFVLTFQTDSYGIETSWSLRNDDAGVLVGYGPPDGASYGNFGLYAISYCLDVGASYTLAMEDDFGDGMCCMRGHGGYEYRIDGTLVYTSGLLRTFDDYVEHAFTVREGYTPSPTKDPTSGGEGGGEESDGANSRCVPSPSTCGCDDVLQSDYRGSISTTVSGLGCQYWDTQDPHVHDYSPESYPNAGLDGNNHCRSPGGIDAPWCFTTDPNVEWDYCRVPSCMTVEVPAPTYNPTFAEKTPSPTKEPSTTSPTLSPSVSWFFSVVGGWGGGTVSPRRVQIDFFLPPSASSGATEGRKERSRSWNRLRRFFFLKIFYYSSSFGIFCLVDPSLPS
jgi:hypothetical protein